MAGLEGRDATDGPRAAYGRGGRCHRCNMEIKGVLKDQVYTCAACAAAPEPEAPPGGRMIHGDALGEMRRLPSGSFGTIVTSPPYNVCRNAADTGPTGPPTYGTSFGYTHPGYDGYDDALPQAEYVKWQADCLREMYRLLRPDGCCYYNHRYRHRNGPMDDLRWIHDAVPVRQIVVWNRKQNMNTAPWYYNPIHENIYVIAGPEWRRRVNRTRGTCDNKPGAYNMTSIWTTNYAEHVYGHPAPFPVELVDQCLDTNPDPGPVLDPFMGSGTVAVAAARRGLEWTGIEQSANYCRTALERVRREGVTGQRRLLE